MRGSHLQFPLEGPMKALKKSRQRQSAVSITFRTSSLTRVLKTRVLIPALAVASLIRATVSRALSSVSINGTVSRWNSTPLNCVRRLCPSVSAVIPVRSERKKTARDEVCRAVTHEG
jgi:hypothetical protein